jgi:hypothetical protein
MLRTATPDLPDEPTTEQVEAWIELAELVPDADFAASIRRMAEHPAADRADGDRTGLHPRLTEQIRDAFRPRVPTTSIRRPRAPAPWWTISSVCTQEPSA